MVDAVGVVVTVLTAVSNFFQQFMTATGSMPVIMAMLFIFFSIRFILTPIFGGSGSSDKAKKDKEV